MPIKGLTAFRSNRKINGKFVSASHIDFEWTSQVVWAKCPWCPKDEDGHIIHIGDDCGIYGTLTKGEVESYMDDESYVLFLVEALGKYWGKYDKTWEVQGGFQAPGAQIVAVVDYIRPKIDVVHQPVIKPITSNERIITPAMLNMMEASERFNVPIINLNVAWDICKTMWEQLMPKEYPWAFT